jgi:glyoxylase-like metal-dependent hydrolase (beta-lactamase superfamily II)
MVKLPDKWAPLLLSQPETGMRYQVVSVWLRDGRCFEQVVIDSGYITRVRGFADIPFDPLHITRIVVTHAKWDWKPGRAQ